MAVRLKRSEQTERNRSLVLAAARRVFLARGYHGASLDQIAEEAGFSKGVVYSQFRNKADLFLALLEARIAERAEENARLVAGMDGHDAVARLVEHLARVGREQADWGLLVIEFRVQAARDPELNARYAAVHARTVDALAEVVEQAFAASGVEPPAEPRPLAEFVLGAGAGVQLEKAANEDALGGDLGFELLTRLITRSEERTTP
jgi:AcrR family transcriptional regulator